MQVAFHMPLVFFFYFLAITCEVLPDIANGTISYDMTSIYVLGAVATYMCDNGFYLEGEAQRTCTSRNRISGVFDGKEPTCICKEYCILFLIEHHNLQM